MLVHFLLTHHQLVSIKWDCCSFCARQLKKFMEGFVGHYCLVVDTSVPTINLFVLTGFMNMLQDGSSQTVDVVSSCVLGDLAFLAMSLNVVGMCSAGRKGRAVSFMTKIVDIVFLKVVCSSTLFDVQYKHFPTHSGI